jgi:conjugative transfer signal peptidase TraF
MIEGIYIKRSGSIITRRDTVALCLTPAYADFAVKRGYLLKGGACPDSYPLIKKVVAVPGDTVILTDDAVRVNNVSYPYKTYYADSLHRPLFVYPRGIYINTAGYWVIGVNDPRSWDSRYFGYISAAQIVSKVRRVASW